MSKSSKIVAGVVVVIILAGSAWLLISKWQPKNPQFKLGLNTWVGSGPLWLAEEKGFFADEGVDVEVVLSEDVARRKEALANGEVDGVVGTVGHLALLKNEGAPSIAVMELGVSSDDFGVLAVEGTGSIQDLEEKRVAVEKDSASELFLDYVLQKNGLSPTGVQKVDMDTKEANIAFVSGEVDAIVTFEPWLSQARQRKSGKVLVSGADEPDTVVDVLMVNASYLAQNSEAVKKFMRAWFRAVDYWRANPEEANAIMTRYYGVPPEEFANMISGLAWPSREENIEYFGSSENPGEIYKIANTFANVFLETGRIEFPPDITEAIDGRLLRQL